jgi:hypothetical protein
MAAKREDGCEAVKDAVGNLAKKLGGELFRNKDGFYVLKMWGTGAIFPTEAATTDHLMRVLRTAQQNAEAQTTTIDSAPKQRRDWLRGDWSLVLVQLLITA